MCADVQTVMLARKRLNANISLCLTDANKQLSDLLFKLQIFTVLHLDGCEAVKW